MPSLKKYVSGDLQILLVGNAFESAMRFGAFVIYSRILQPADLGLVAAVTAIVYLVTDATAFGIDAAVISLGSKEFGRGDRDALSRLCRAGLWLHLALGVVVAGTACLVAPVLAGTYFGESDLTRVLLVAFAGSPFLRLSEYALSVLRSYQRFRFHAVAGIGGALFLLGGSVVLWLSERVTLLNVVVLVLFWTPLVKLALGLVRVPGSVLALGRPDGTRMRRLLGFGRWVWGTQLLESGVKRVNILLLQAFVGNVATGYFHMGSRYVEFLSLVFQPLRKYLLPKLTALETLEQMGAALRRTYAGLAFTLLLIPAAWIAGGPVITWAQGSEWLPAVELFRILVVARLLVLLAKPMSFVLFSLDRPRSQMLAHAVGALAYLVCAAALIPSLGARGGAYSILVFSVAVFLALAWTLSREWKRARSAGPAAADASSADSFYLDP